MDNYSDCSREPRGRDVDDRDQQGFDVAEFRIRVEESNSPPTVTALSPLQSQTVDVGDSVTFRARATDDDGNISQVDWYVNRSWETGGSLSPTGRTERSYTHRFSSAGSYRIEVEFTDTEGESDSVYWEVYLIDPPIIDSLGCSDSRVEVGETVSCSPRFSGGSATSYLWGSIGGNPWSGTSRTFSTQWDSPGQKTIVFEACNDDGCDSGEHNVVVDQRPLNPPTIDRLGCGDSRVEVGETVSCSPRLSGGSATSYLWGSIGGNPWNGTSRAFSTQWDTAGQKTIVFEACNNDGCDSGEHNVVVDARPLNPPVVNSLGCSDSRVEVGETVTCSSTLSGGTPTRYIWGSIDGNPWSGTSRSFSTQWDTAGQKTIVFEACNNDGCSNGEHWVDVVQGADPPPIIHSLDCSSSNVMTAENVACSARLGGGSPSRYQWSTRGGSPSSENSSSFSTHWDSPGNKQITLEVCNDGGCDTSQLAVVVEREVPATLRVTTSGQILAGSSITVIGSGFPVFRGVDDVSVDGRTVPLQFGPSTDGNGEFTVRIAVPSLSPGTYDVVAEVYGKAARTSVRIESARTPNRAPTVSLVSPPASVQINVGVQRTFTAQASDTDGNLVKVEWFVNGQTRHGESLNSVGSARDSLDYRVQSPGNVRLSVTFTDADGASDSAEWRIEGISPEPPPRVDGLGCGPLAVAIEETVTCNPRLSGGDAFSYSWRADGGVPWSGGQETFSTAWRTAGRKAIELEVCNSEGDCDSRSQTITVVASTSERPIIQTLVLSHAGNRGI